MGPRPQDFNGQAVRGDGLGRRVGVRWAGAGRRGRGVDGLGGGQGVKLLQGRLDAVQIPFLSTAARKRDALCLQDLDNITLGVAFLLQLADPLEGGDSGLSVFM